MSKIAWGIDAGHSSVKFVKLSIEEHGDGKMKATILDSGTYPNEEFLLREALAKVWLKGIERKDQVAVGMCGSETLCRFTKLPPVAPKRIPEIVAYEAAQQIPYGMDDVEWYYHVMKVEGLPDTEVGIFAVRKELLSAKLKKFEEAEFGAVHVIQSNDIALYNALKYYV